MATFYGADYTTSFVSVTSGSGAVGTMKAGGRVRAIVDSYTTVASMGTGAVMVFGGALVEDGATVIDAWVSHPALTGVSAKLTVQTDGVATDVISAGVFTSAAVARFSQGQLPLTVSHSAANDGQIAVTVTAGTPAAAKTISVCVFYMID